MRLDPDPEVSAALERVIRRVLKEHGIEPAKRKGEMLEPPKPEHAETLHDLIFLGKPRKPAQAGKRVNGEESEASEE